MVESGLPRRDFVKAGALVPTPAGAQATFSAARSDKHGDIAPAVTAGEQQEFRVHHPTMPSVGKTAQAVVATGRLEDSLHASMMTILRCLCKTMAPASSAVPRHPTGSANYGSRLVAKGLLTLIRPNPERRCSRRSDAWRKCPPRNGCPVTFS